MSLIEEIDDELKDAMRARDAERRDLCSHAERGNKEIPNPQNP